MQNLSQETSRCDPQCSNYFQYCPTHTLSRHRQYTGIRWCVNCVCLFVPSSNHSVLVFIPPACHSAHYSERVQYAYHSSDRRKESVVTYEASDHGSVVRLLESDWQKEQRKEMCGAFVLPNGERNQDFCRGLMNTELDELGGNSVVDYASNVGGVYVWFSSQATPGGIKHESKRFLTQGQNHRHNAVLMWNPHGHEFENNTCPIKERLNRGLVALTKDDCRDLGIEYFLLVDGELTLREARNIEKMFTGGFSLAPCRRRGSRHRRKSRCRCGGASNDRNHVSTTQLLRAPSRHLCGGQRILVSQTMPYQL